MFHLYPIYFSRKRNCKTTTEGKYICSYFYLLSFCLETRLHEAGYFYAISQNSELTVDFVQLTEQEKTEDHAAPILRAMEKIAHLDPEVVLIDTDTKNIKILLGKVTKRRKGICFFLVSVIVLLQKISLLCDCNIPNIQLLHQKSHGEDGFVVEFYSGC